jgi:hypothetical protein
MVWWGRGDRQVDDGERTTPIKARALAVWTGGEIRPGQVPAVLRGLVLLVIPSTALDVARHEVLQLPEADFARGHRGRWQGWRPVCSG